MDTQEKCANNLVLRVPPFVPRNLCIVTLRSKKQSSYGMGWDFVDSILG